MLLPTCLFRRKANLLISLLVMAFLWQSLGGPQSERAVASDVPFSCWGISISSEGTCLMRFSEWKKLVLAASALFVLTGVSVRAQSGSTDESKRKVKSRVSPVYPELARRMNVAGKVKIEVVISPDGRIKTTRVVGGHPLLVQACQDAVK